VDQVLADQDPEGVVLDEVVAVEEDLSVQKRDAEHHHRGGEKDDQSAMAADP
jgi:hypothetical protein